MPTNHTVTLSWEGQRATKDSIIQEVAWVHNATLTIKEINRSGDNGSVILFDLSHKLDRTGRAYLGEKGEQRDSGWIDAVCRWLRCTRIKRSRLLHSHNISIVFPSRRSALTRRLAQRGRLQPHCAVQPCRLEYPQVADRRPLGSHKRSVRSRRGQSEVWDPKRRVVTQTSLPLNLLPISSLNHRRRRMCPRRLNQPRRRIRWGHHPMPYQNRHLSSNSSSRVLPSAYPADG